MLSKRAFQCPPGLMARAAGRPPLPMAVVAANSAVALQSAAAATTAGLIEPVLVGDGNAIRRIADAERIDLFGWRIVEAADDAEAAATSAALARSGEVAALMKGHLHTDILMRAALDKDTGLRAGRRMTHVFHMTVPDCDRALLITDAAVNVTPDLKTRLDIVHNAVDLARAIGVDRPKVALLSATEDPIPSMPTSMEARETQRALEAQGIEGFSVLGPLALDIAVSPEAARAKGVDHPVAGHADIIAVPNIETGNGLFKMMVYFMGATAAGIVLGAKVPIVLTSRADPPEARLAAAALAALMAPAPATA